MSRLGELVLKVRSKNAGPFWITVDIFCGSETAFKRVCEGLNQRQLASVLQIQAEQIKRFEIPSLNVVKISFPRPVVQGSRQDRDMHGAAYGAIIGDIELG